MNGYYGLLNIIKTSLMQNGEVKTVVTQDIDVNEIFANYKHDIFPFAQIVTSTATIDKGVTTFDVEIGLADIIDTPKKVVEDKFNGVSNQIDIYNTLYVILRRVADQLINDTYTTDLTIAGNPSLDKFLIPEHQACGWTLSFQIEVPNTISYCVDIPDLPQVTCDLSYTELEGVYTITWESENADVVYLNGSPVGANGSIETETPLTSYSLLAKRGIDVCYSSISITGDDTRITYANRIGEDGGSIVGFDLLEDDINIPVGRKEGKLYAYNEDDYSVIRNGGAWEFTRYGVYKEVGVDVPRFDWINGIQELLVEGHSTNLIDSSNESNYFNFNASVTGLNFVDDSVLAPDNTVTAYKALPTNLGTSRGGSGNMLLTTGFYTWSFFAKAPVAGIWTPRQFFGNFVDSGSNYIDINITTEWKRFELVFELTSDITQRLYLLDSREGNTNISEAHFWGHQLEEGTEATSPIITNGSIVTRPADIITNSQGQLAPGRYDSI